MKHINLISPKGYRIKSKLIRQHIKNLEKTIKYLAKGLKLEQFG